MNKLTYPVADDSPTFADIERCHDLHELNADIAIIGVPYGIPYPSSKPGQPSPAEGPAAIREHSQRYGRFFDNFDIDLGGPILNNLPIRMVDCGNVIGTFDGGGRKSRSHRRGDSSHSQ